MCGFRLNRSIFKVTCRRALGNTSKVGRTTRQRSVWRGSQLPQLVETSADEYNYHPYLYCMAKKSLPVVNSSYENNSPREYLLRTILKGGIVAVTSDVFSVQQIVDAEV